MPDRLFPADRVAVVGHRGAPRLHRENTPESFAAAHAAGATWVELDARLTADGGAAVHHDAALADGRSIVSLDDDDLAAAGVHRLGAVLDALPSGLGVDVEVKNFPGEPDYDESNAVVGACVELCQDPRRPVFLSSFNPLVLAAAADMGWTWPMGLLTHGASLDIGIATATELGCRVLCPHDGTEGLHDDGVRAVAEAGLEIMVWTVDEPARIVQLADWGVGAVCTNDPGGAVRALATSRRA